MKKRVFLGLGGLVIILITYLGLSGVDNTVTPDDQLAIHRALDTTLISKDISTFQEEINFIKKRVKPLPDARRGKGGDISAADLWPPMVAFLHKNE